MPLLVALARFCGLCALELYFVYPRKAHLPIAPRGTDCKYLTVRLKHSQQPEPDNQLLPPVFPPDHR